MRPVITCFVRGFWKERTGYAPLGKGPKFQSLFFKPDNSITYSTQQGSSREVIKI